MRSCSRLISTASKPKFRQPKFIGLSGSCRNGSLNTLLVKAAASIAADAGAVVNIIDMNHYVLPVFNEDIEKDMIPSSVRELKAAFVDCDGFIVASPEYNGSMTPLLCNTLAWMSRTLGEKEGKLKHYSYYRLSTII